VPISLAVQETMEDWDGLATANAPVTAFDPHQIRETATQDLDVFAGIVMPHIAVYPFPPFYRELWLLCIKSFLDLAPGNKLFKLLLVLPRGHAKTTFVKLLVAYGLIHRLFDFIQVLCASDNNAESFIADVVTLLSHQNVRQLYGDWETGLLDNNATEKRSYFMGRRCLLKAASVLSGTVRGTQKDMIRPDFILFDDVQTREVAASDVLSEKVADAVVGTAMKAKSPHRCGIVYIGNSYPKNCIADKLAQSGEFVTLRTGAILADGTSLWPALHSVEDLRSEYKLDASLGKAHIWMAEVQNLPLERDGVLPLFPDGTIPLTLRDQGLERLGAFITVDPAGSNPNADDTALGAHVVWEGMRTELAYVEGEILAPRATIMKALKLAMDFSAPLIFVESVAYQSTLAFWGNEVIRELGLGQMYRFVPLPAGRGSKLSRIRAWVGELLAGQYTISDNEVRARILYQGLAFNALRTDNRDDLLDTAAYGTVVRSMHMQEVLNESRRFAANKQYKLQATVVHGSLQANIRRLYRIGGRAG
jgi:hypothetical protein